MQTTVVRSAARTDRVGWAIALGSLVAIGTVLAGVIHTNHGASTTTTLLVGQGALFVAPPVLGFANGLRGGSVGATLVIGLTPAVAALVINVIEILAGASSFASTLPGSALLVGVVGMVTALCGLGVGYAGQVLTTAIARER